MNAAKLAALLAAKSLTVVELQCAGYKVLRAMRGATVVAEVTTETMGLAQARKALAAAV